MILRYPYFRKPQNMRNSAAESVCYWARLSEIRDKEKSSKGVQVWPCRMQLATIHAVLWGYCRGVLGRGNGEIQRGGAT